MQDINQKYWLVFDFFVLHFTPRFHLEHISVFSDFIFQDQQLHRVRNMNNNHIKTDE